MTNTPGHRPNTDGRFGSPWAGEWNGVCSRCHDNPADRRFHGNAKEGFICPVCWLMRELNEKLSTKQSLPEQQRLQ